jgi:hypothetical protein
MDRRPERLTTRRPTDQADEKEQPLKVRTPTPAFKQVGSRFSFKGRSKISKVLPINGKIQVATGLKEAMV